MPKTKMRVDAGQAVNDQNVELAKINLEQTRIVQHCGTARFIGVCLTICVIAVAIAVTIIKICDRPLWEQVIAWVLCPTGLGYAVVRLICWYTKTRAAESCAIEDN